MESGENLNRDSRLTTCLGVIIKIKFVLYRKKDIKTFKNKTIMKELVLFVASMTPEDVLLNKMEEALLAHKNNPTKETKQELNSTVMLWMTKMNIEMEGLENVSKSLDKHKQFLELHKTKDKDN